MKKLLTIYEKDVFPEVKSSPNSEYKVRKAARAAVFDSEDMIALMHVSKKNYHKLPGGGLQGTESVFQALERELQEEIGCKAVITKEVGEIIEYRDAFDKQLQYSYCFIAKLVGEKGTPKLERDEIEDGFEVIWVPLARAIEILSTDKTDDYQGNFILKRDLAFLKEAKRVINE